MIQAKKKYLQIVNIGLFLAFLMIIRILIPISNIWNYVLYTFGLILLILYLYFKSGKSLISFSLLYILYYVGGLAVYWLRDKYWYNYPGDIDVVAKVGFVGLFSLINAYCFSKVISSLIPRRSILKLNYSDIDIYNDDDTHIKIINRLSLFFFIIGLIFAIIIFKNNAPIFSSDIDLARILISSTTAKYMPGFMLLFQVLFLQLSIPITFRWRRFGLFNYIICILTLILLSLNGSRFYVFFPFVFFVIWLYILNRLQLRKIFTIGLFFIIVSSMVISWRLFHEAFNVNAVYADSLPEMRSFALAVTVIPIGVYGVRLLTTIFGGLFPSTLLSLVGLDKTVLYQPIGGFILSFFPQFTDILGLRISFIGELYISLGLPSVIIVFSIIGLILFFLDNIVQSTKLRAIVTSLLMLTIPYGSIFLITVIQIFTISFVVELTLVKLIKHYSKVPIEKPTELVQ